MKYKDIRIPALLLLLVLLPAVCLAAQADYDKGIAYLRAGKAGEAISILEPLRASGGGPYVEYHLGIAYYRAGRLDEAGSAFRKTLSLAGKGGEFALGAAFSNLGVEYYRAGELDKAAACFGEALGLSPEDGDSMYYLGLVKIESGDYQGALAELAKAGELLGSRGASVAAVQNAMGLAHYKSGDNDKAAAEFTKALEKDPGNVEALYYLGQINYKERGYAAARTYFDRIAHTGAADEKTRRTLFTTFFNMGVDFQDRGKSETAAEMFERAALLDPDDAETHYYLGYNLMAALRYEDAMAEFRQALALDPGLDRAKSQMEVAGKFASEKALEEAESMLSAGEYYAAVPLYEKAAALDPSSGPARKGLDAARAALKKDTASRAARAREVLAEGDYVEAGRLSDELLRLNPDSPEAAALERDVSKGAKAAAEGLGKKARDAQARGALGEAAEYYAALLKIDPDNAAAKDGLSQANATIGRTRHGAGKAASDGLLVQARDAYRELLGYLPGDAEAASGLKSVEQAIALELARRLKDARESFGSEDYTMAAYHAGRAMELDPANPEAMELREKIRSRSMELVLRHVKEGDGYMERGMREKASESYEAALLLDPGNRAAKNGLERARTAQAPAGDEDELRRLYLKGVEYYTQGRLDLAVEAWREVLRIDPSNEKASSSIRRAEEKMRQTEDQPSQAGK